MALRGVAEFPSPASSSPSSPSSPSTSTPAGGPGLPLNTIRQIWGAGTRAGLYPLSPSSYYWYTCFNADEAGERLCGLLQCQLNRTQNQRVATGPGAGAGAGAQRVNAGPGGACRYQPKLNQTQCNRARRRAWPMLDNGVARDISPIPKCTEFPVSQQTIPQTGRKKAMSGAMRGRLCRTTGRAYGQAAPCTGGLGSVSECKAQLCLNPKMLLCVPTIRYVLCRRTQLRRRRRLRLRRGRRSRWRR